MTEPSLLILTPASRKPVCTRASAMSQEVFEQKMFLKSLHISRMVVRYGLEMRPLTQEQTLLVLQYQLGRKYNKRKLRDANTDKPYFTNFTNCPNSKHDVFFFTDMLPLRDSQQ